MQFTCKNKNENSTVTLTEHSGGEGIVLLDVDLHFDEPQIPQPLTVAWTVDCVDMYSTFQPNEYYNRRIGPNWRMRRTDARLASSAPMHQLISRDGRNRMTIALSDAETPTQIATGVNEKTAALQCEATFFTTPVNYITDYHATIYLDFTDRAYEKSLRAVHTFWEECGYFDAYVPDDARWPMYSTWYSYHQAINVDSIVEQCRMAKAMGMDSVIVDDGWQIGWEQNGYITCGDWEVVPEKVPDMKEFVDRVHALGMKFLLWFSVPFVGRESRAIKRFRDMVLDPTKVDTAIASSFDPRFPEVRRHLVDIFAGAVRDWGLDGLKLDFIDSIRLSPNTPAFDERWDTLSLEQGIDWLLRDITDAVRAINPEIMIEFRQSYFGPTICKYASMIRVGDCPEDAIENHVRGITLRYSLNRTAAHSDMLMWHADDPVEAAAAQVISTLYMVPQISVLLDKIPESHRRMLAFYLAFWRENREVLLDGELTAEDPAQLYSLVKAELNGHAVVTAYTKPVLTAEQIDRLDFVNATGGDTLYLDLAADCGEKPFRIFDCQGNLTDNGTICLTAGIHRISVPRCGMVRIG
ncbi:MAG: alpha-galactosidase [Clostridia bacterium]|nr:alpha-galactosidase [Clostridia bacterium]